MLEQILTSLLKSREIEKGCLFCSLNQVLEILALLGPSKVPINAFKTG